MNVLTLNDDGDLESPVDEIRHSRTQNQNRAWSSIISAGDSRARSMVIGALVVLAAVCLGVLLLHPFAFSRTDAPASLLHGLLQHLRKLIAGHSLVSITVYPIAVLVICTLEYWFPAVPTQKILSAAFVHDALWALMQGAFDLLFLGWYGMALSRMYTHHLSFLTLPMPHSMPMVVRFAIGAVVLDLMRWWQHWLHHRLTFLWPFHAVHHSQPQINLFSNSRIHVVELMVSSALVVLPMMMLNVEAPAAIWWALLLNWHARLCHANIKSDFGPLHYLFVTPQSHRVHHSNRAEHFDQNYGAVFSIWDHLFGTQCRQYDVYPTTGVDDKNFPVEKTQSVLSLLASPLRQTVYPFRYLPTMMFHPFRLWIKIHPAAAASLARARHGVAPPIPMPALASSVDQYQGPPVRPRKSA
jgi:sterol desaturase/sphingolipid hydroxylase (fatty acid hydroxylase superfamily)